MKKLNYGKILLDAIVKFGLKLGGFQAWIVELVVERIYKKAIPLIIQAWNTALDKLQDNKDLKKYVDEQAKGKNSDENQKLQDQLDLLNPKHK